MSDIRSLAARPAEFLGLNRNLLLVLIVIVVIGAGEEMWMRFLPKYLQALGAGALVIGLFDGLKTLLGAVYAWPGGVAVDRWGHRNAFQMFTLASVAGYSLCLLVPDSAAVIAGTFLFLSWSCFSLPALFSIVAENLAPNRHAMGIGMQSLVKRLPVLVGPVIGGMLIDRLGIVAGVRVGFAVSVALGFVAMALQRGITKAAKAHQFRTEGFLAVVRAFPPALRWLLFSDILIRFCERIPYAWIVIYAMDHLGASATLVGLLTTVEMLMATACYIPAAHLADRYGREPFVIATFLFFTLFPIMLLGAESLPLLVLAFVVRGLKEFGEPARKALIVGSCVAEKRGRMVGAYYLIRDLVVTPGAFLGAWLWQFGPHVNFIAAAAVGLAGSVVYVSTLRRAKAPDSSSTV